VTGGQAQQVVFSELMKGIVAFHPPFFHSLRGFHIYIDAPGGCAFGLPPPLWRPPRCDRQYQAQDSFFVLPKCCITFFAWISGLRMWNIFSRKLMGRLVVKIVLYPNEIIDYFGCIHIELYRNVGLHLSPARHHCLIEPVAAVGDVLRFISPG
jgi:hypothetical protein